MAAAVSSVWAIDIGTNSLKALRLEKGDDGFEVIAFDYIEHSKVLSSGEVNEVERDEIIAETLHKFASRNDVTRDEVAIAVAGHNSFSRFIKLPPVDKKGIPKIVQFEAVQQIPFDINEVEWDWQEMDNPDTPDTEVGLFAIKNELISGIMDSFGKEGMNVSCVQISPMALYNYLIYDRDDVDGANQKATVILDMGAENTTLVVCTKTSVWQRSIRIGGNAFTEAIADAFKLRFQKAEKLKRTAIMSKYVRQIFGAMKPVYTDLGSEVQRSLGFYSSSGPGHEKGFSKVIALGGGMKLKGVAKYLQQSLGIPVIKPDSFEKLTLSPEVSSAKFHQNVSDFAVAYGLGVQLFGESKIRSNLLPRKIARAMAWARKGKMFTVAASLLLFVMVLSLAKAGLDKGKYTSQADDREYIKNIISSARQAEGNLKKQTVRDSVIEKIITEEMDYFKYRDIIPKLNEAMVACLPVSNDPDQKRLQEAFEQGDITTIKSFDRKERKQMFITGLTVHYAKSLEEASFSGLKDKKGKKRARQESKTQLDFNMMMMMNMMGGPGGMMGPGGMGMGMGPGGPRTVQRKDRVGGKPEEDEDKLKDSAGFVVIIEGYSPYKDIQELLDPDIATDDQENLGFVTNLERLSKVVEGCPFELFTKGDSRHFKVDIEDVELDGDDMPEGIGIEREFERVPKEPEEDNQRRRGMMGIFGGGGRARTGQERVEKEIVLIDPMTKEEMGKTFDLVTVQDVENDPELSERDIGTKKTKDFNNETKYIVRDHWFRVSLKLRWDDAPVKPDEDKDKDRG